MSVLPDVLGPNLDIVFCGTAAGAASAAAGAYYAGPGNVFWATLHAVGLAPCKLRAHEFRRLAEWNMGLTDLAKHVSGSDSALSADDFDVDRLRGLIVKHRPRIVAFTGKRAAAEFVGRDLGYGLMPDSYASARLFVLPSPSGAARKFWNREHWLELSRLRAAAP